MCLSVHGVHLLLVPGLWALWLAGPSRSAAASSPWQVPALALLAGAAIAIAMVRYVQAADAACHAEKVHRKLDRVLTDRFVTSLPRQIPISQADPASGPADAPHTVVVFEDFQCQTCAEFREALRYVEEHLDCPLRIVHKDFPLNAACNPSRKDTDVRDHDHACQAAAAAEAAWRLGGSDAFVAMRDLLFEKQALLAREPYEDFARCLGLDVDRFNRLRTSPAVLRKIRNDACVGSGLGVQSTPAVFVDGRRLENPIIQRGPSILREETLRHWRDVLGAIFFGAEDLGYRMKGTR